MSAERLTIWQAAYVVARRDFIAILFSRAFFFFMLGPLFPIVLGGLAGGIGARVAESTAHPEIGIAMTAPDTDAMLAAHERLAAKLGPAIPSMVTLKRLEPGESYDAEGAIKAKGSNIAAVVSGTPAAPMLTGTRERLQAWKGSVELIAANVEADVLSQTPEARTKLVAESGASNRLAGIRTAQIGQTLLFIVTIFLAGMVLSTLVEEKANKIIEVLAAAIPMDAVFLGKLLAMFLVSMVGVLVWASVIGALVGLASFNSSMVGGLDFSNLPAPGVGWPLFFVFAVLYFTMNYLLLGSVYLAIGSMAATVREVQTLSMPATMAQVVVFFFATFALAAPKYGMVDLAAIAFPLSSPYAMLARAATDEALWPHLFALTWQALWVALFIKAGAALFRKRVMKSGPQGVKKKRRSLAAIIGGRPAVQDR